MESVGNRLSEANGLPQLKYIVVDNDEENAFVSATGIVVVYTGLLRLLDSPDRLAVVLAHELGHFLARKFWLVEQIIMSPISTKVNVLVMIASGHRDETTGLEWVKRALRTFFYAEDIVAIG